MGARGKAPGALPPAPCRSEGLGCVDPPSHAEHSVSFQVQHGRPREASSASRGHAVQETQHPLPSLVASRGLIGPDGVSPLKARGVGLDVGFGGGGSSPPRVAQNTLSFLETPQPATLFALPNPVAKKNKYTNLIKGEFATFSDQWAVCAAIVPTAKLYGGRLGPSPEVCAAPGTSCGAPGGLCRARPVTSATHWGNQVSANSGVTAGERPHRDWAPGRSEGRVDSSLTLSPASQNSRCKGKQTRAPWVVASKHLWFTAETEPRGTGGRASFR
ncbi:unnamed protein product [Gulo gulo]|uniref:Uncharacterized protein n=1 Tax=Gulo gulo TaxID=48420 RepID=A0A9X9QB13_GULGU|nr:unnamed protein product [Gulo gulo]